MTAVPASLGARGASKITKEQKMDGTIIGLVAVIMSLGIPLGAMYTYYCVRKLRTEERSRRAATLLVTGALGYILTFGLIAQIEREPETWVAAVFGIIPLAIGIGYFLDFTLIRRDAQA
jgi:hypothetical protein